MTGASSRIFLTKRRTQQSGLSDTAGVNIRPGQVDQPDNSIPRLIRYSEHIDALKARRRSWVPSLVSLCIVAMVGSSLPSPESYHVVAYSGKPQEQDQNIGRFESDLLTILGDAKSSTSPSPRYHPDIWLKLATLFTTTLPASFRTKWLPLMDPHVISMQHIEPSSRFTLVSVLSLRQCASVDDGNIRKLGLLHQLISLDLSYTSISAAGIQTLSSTLHVLSDQDSTLAGPWKLRLLYLEGCALVNESVCEALAKWPLLCFIGTRNSKWVFLRNSQLLHARRLPWCCMSSITSRRLVFADAPTRSHWATRPPQSSSSRSASPSRAIPVILPGPPYFSVRPLY